MWQTLNPSVYNALKLDARYAKLWKLTCLHRQEAGWMACEL